MQLKLTTEQIQNETQLSVRQHCPSYSFVFHCSYCDFHPSSYSRLRSWYHLIETRFKQLSTPISYLEKISILVLILTTPLLVLFYQTLSYSPTSSLTIPIHLKQDMSHCSTCRMTLLVSPLLFLISVNFFQILPKQSSNFLVWNSNPYMYLLFILDWAIN